MEALTQLRSCTFVLIWIRPISKSALWTVLSVHLYPIHVDENKIWSTIRSLDEQDEKAQNRITPICQPSLWHSMTDPHFLGCMHFNPFELTKNIWAMTLHSLPTRLTSCHNFPWTTTHQHACPYLPFSTQDTVLFPSGFLLFVNLSLLASWAWLPCLGTGTLLILKQLPFRARLEYNNIHLMD